MRYRLTESNLRNIIRTAINEVLDNMDDTEKAYWLMRQRQQRPNTKSKTPVDYGQQFAQQFNGEVYGTPKSLNNNGGYNHNNQNGEYGWMGVGDNGSFYAQHGQGLQSQNWSPNRNFTYMQNAGSNQGDTKISRMRFTPESQPTNLGDVRADDNFTNQFNRGYQRYNQIQQKYNQQRQMQQQPQGNQPQGNQPQGN